MSGQTTRDTQHDDGGENESRPALLEFWLPPTRWTYPARLFRIITPLTRLSVCVALYISVPHPVHRLPTHPLTVLLYYQFKIQVQHRPKGQRLFHACTLDIHAYLCIV